MATYRRLEPDRANLERQSFFQKLPEGGQKKGWRSRGGQLHGTPPPPKKKGQVVSVTKLVFVVCQSKSANLCVPLKAMLGLHNS